MIQMQINNKKMYVDGNEVVLDVPPMLVDDSRTLVPIRAISEALGQNVEWDNETQSITIYGRKMYFDTVDEAAYDWAMHWNAMSIALFKEMSGVIYKHPNGKYYWGDMHISQADDKQVVNNRVEAKKGVAIIHSHGGGKHNSTKTMSNGDFAVARDFKRRAYMVDSGGCLWVYDPNEDKPKQKLVREGCPKDARWMDIYDSAKSQREYFKNNYHDLRDKEFEKYNLGFKADFYNKLHMNGLSYLKERAE